MYSRFAVISRKVHLLFSHCIKESFLQNLSTIIFSSKLALSRGISDRVNLSVVIINEGKDAHQAKFYVNAPLGLSFVGVTVEDLHYRIQCTPLNSTSEGEDGGRFGS